MTRMTRTGQGGETEFPLANLRVRPAAGDAVLFYNLKCVCVCQRGREGDFR